MAEIMVDFEIWAFAGLVGHSKSKDAVVYVRSSYSDQIAGKHLPMARKAPRRQQRNSLMMPNIIDG
jgi:hypothetical protein